MVSRSVLAPLAVLAAIPLLAQQLRLPAVTPNCNALGPAIHKFVTNNTNLPPPMPPQKAPEKKPWYKKPWYLRMPKTTLIAPNTPVNPQRFNRVCSIPLTNVRPGVVQPRMPTITPRDIDRMPNIVPAPPCTDWPPK
jgi:hypothetical protein